MNQNDLFLYYDKPCKFKLRGGKEVYGVIWKDRTPIGEEHFFASSEDYHSIQATPDKFIAQQLKVPINIDDVVAAEMLQGIIPGKDMFK